MMDQRIDFKHWSALTNELPIPNSSRQSAGAQLAHSEQRKNGGATRASHAFSKNSSHQIAARGPPIKLFFCYLL